MSTLEPNRQIVSHSLFNRDDTALSSKDYVSTQGVAVFEHGQNITVIAIPLRPVRSISRRSFYVSIIKSVTRIIAGIALVLSLDNPYIIAAGSLLIIAELLGILEELV